MELAKTVVASGPPAVAEAPAPALVALKPPDTFLPHWGPIRRAIHSKCKRSRFFNTVVGAIEMRLGRGELLSLPQYMSLCPTGQCNALCAFCSVTTNRTGIIKKQLAFEKLDRFLAPVVNTIRMYGLEGNGEPTLYERFDDLVRALTARGARFYLITNGEQLTAEQIDLLLAHGVDSINFSLNAATAATHQRVMKLKHFDRVVANIKRLVANRGHPESPMLSVSVVVDQDNIHEIQECLRFGEYDLGVNRVLIRPLSEIANDQGAVEDMRELVPFESDVKDMLEGVREYLEDVPRKCEIFIKPDEFKNVRPDPLDRVLMPRGFEDRLLAPRRRYWEKTNPDLQLSWHLNTAKLSCPALARPGVLCYSAPTPVEPGKKLTFRCKARVEGGPLTIAVTDVDGERVAWAEVAPGGQAQDVALPVDTGPHDWLRLSFIHGGGALNAELDFERLRSPGSGLKREFKLPHPRRWQAEAPDAQVSWLDSAIRLRWKGEPSRYLVKTYSVQCLPGKLISLSVKVNVRSGRLGIGILSENFGAWTQQFQYDTGDYDELLEVNTATNRRLQVVLYSLASEPLDAEINWGDALELAAKRAEETGLASVLRDNAVAKVEDQPARQLPEKDAAATIASKPSSAALESIFKLPSPWRWWSNSPDARVVWNGSVARVCWSGAPGPYLIKSPAMTCLPGQTIELSVKVDVRSGKLCIGVLNQDASAWTQQFSFDEGKTEKALLIATGNNATFQLALFSQASKPLDAEIDWLDRIRGGTGPARKHGESAAVESVPEPPPATLAKAAAPANVFAPDVTVSPAVADGKAPPLNTASILGWPFAALAALWRWIFGGKVKYYCQKPYTDLHNFSVDGRMDVCCIATGASQQRYALGNLMQQDFQAVWNGERAQEFRRTVNSDKPLPPCQRCPMAFQYHGPFFHPEHTLSLIRYKLNLALQRLPLWRVWVALIYYPVSWFFSLVVFRGFKRSK